MYEVILSVSTAPEEQASAAVRDLVAHSPCLWSLSLSSSFTPSVKRLHPRFLPVPEHCPPQVSAAFSEDQRHGVMTSVKE